MSRRTIAYQYLGVAVVFLLLAGLCMQFQRDIRGTLLVFFVIVPGAFAAFGNLAMPLREGREMSLPHFNAAAVVVFDLATVLALIGLAHRSALGFDIVMALDFASILLCSASFIATIRALRRDAAGWFQLPLYLVTLLLTSIVNIGVCFLLEIAALTQIVWTLIGIPPVPRGPIQPVEFAAHPLGYHLIWFLGHPEVYVLGLFAVGLAAEGMRRIFRRR